jgi:hypothetical protein
VDVGGGGGVFVDREGDSDFVADGSRRGRAT